MVVDLNALQPGQTLFAGRLTVAAEASAAYREAVEDGCVLHARERLLPPMAVAALVMGVAMRSVEMPAGAVHTGQELDFLRPLPEGSALECSASVARNSVRRGTRFLTLEVRAMADGELAVSGRTAIAIQIEVGAVQEPGVAREGEGD